MKADAVALPPADDPSLSAVLGRVIADGEEALSLQEIAERTGGRGSYLLLIFLCLPFTTPIPLPGVSTVVGLVIVWIALADAGASGLYLPGKLGQRRVSVDRLRKVLQASRRLVGWIEKVVRPRHGEWLAGCAGRRAHALLLAFLASLLLLPLPIPFTNALPGYAIILISACLMERDGRMIIVAYLLSLAATVYVGAFIVGGAGLIQAGWNWIASGSTRTL